MAWLDLDPRAGHEQAGRRPALVLSPQPYNEKTGLAVVCPLTNTRKGYPFEIRAPIGKRPSVVLADHVKSVDWVARRAELLGALPAEIVDQVAATIAALIGAGPL
ncbi:MAG TPA: type II toxin-antitoxin system PemK/MazF family toxin [Candidatus Baltobacteraceae bacterium]|nr:type II toxin-antitoxin system PemK/MazF family toxin [Candidatus Baltobacteraceae bacterium]